MSNSEALPIVARWTGHVEAHDKGGFVAYGDYLAATATIQALQEEVARLKPDAERWRALKWHWDDERDMGPGGRWWCSIMCDNKPATPAAAIDQARKAQKGGA